MMQGVEKGFRTAGGDSGFEMEDCKEPLAGLSGKPGRGDRGVERYGFAQAVQVRSAVGAFFEMSPEPAALG